MEKPPRKGKSVRLKIELVPIKDLAGAEYNPRKRDAIRMEALKESLRKLGFLSPLFATPKGRLLSGHQRTYIAKMLGYTRVPVVRVVLSDEKEEGANLMYNRLTCDISATMNNKDAFDLYVEAYSKIKVGSDIAPDTVYPCMDNLSYTDPRVYVDQLPPLTIEQRQLSKSLVTTKNYIPIVVSKSGRLLNGNLRLYGAIQKGYLSVPQVVVADDLADYASLALNHLSMDFDLGSKLTNQLRYMSYRRRGSSAAVVGLSRTYGYFAFGKVVKVGRNITKSSTVTAEDSLRYTPLASEEMREKYRAAYGDVLVDFGAGSFHDSDIMKAAGFEVYAFEPYALDDNWKPDLGRSRESARELFRGLKKHAKSGVDSIVSSYNMNSIPYHKDRMAYLCIAAAMCKLKTRFYLGTHVVDPNRMVGSTDLGIEANMTINTSSRDYKVQKFFHPEELERMARVFFRKVTIKKVGTGLFASCSHPKRIPRSLLLESIELEFDLPHKDGRLGLVEEAKEAFSVYMGRDL